MVVQSNSNNIVYGEKRYLWSKKILGHKLICEMPEKSLIILKYTKYFNLPFMKIAWFNLNFGVSC